MTELSRKIINRNEMMNRAITEFMKLNSKYKDQDFINAEMFVEKENAFVKLDKIYDKYIKVVLEEDIFKEDEGSKDAIIVADGGVVDIVREYAPNTEIHISTQANTVSYHTCKFWHRNGAKRIILARACMKPFEVLLIDEGLNQIDINLERKILKNMFKRYHDKTIIIVSHRKNNFDLYDKVLEMKKGKIFEV